jgi:hypothetical protein
MFVFKRRVEFKKLKKILDKNTPPQAECCCCCKGAHIIDFNSIMDGLAKIVFKFMIIEAITRLFFFMKK